MEDIAVFMAHGVSMAEDLVLDHGVMVDLVLEDLDHMVTADFLVEDFMAEDFMAEDTGEDKCLFNT